MVGSTPEQFETWMAVLKCFGPDPMIIGPVGSAAAVKLALNQLIGSLTSAFATSLGFVMRQGADVDLFMQILRKALFMLPPSTRNYSECSIEITAIPISQPST